MPPRFATGRKNSNSDREPPPADGEFRVKRGTRTGNATASKWNAWEEGRAEKGEGTVKIFHFRSFSASFVAP